MGFVPYTGLFILGSNDIFGTEAAKLCPPQSKKIWDQTGDLWEIGEVK